MRGKCQCIAILILCLGLSDVSGQEPGKIIRQIFDDALTDSTAWKNLRHLCLETPGRLPGSEQAVKAVEFTFRALAEAGADSVWLQKVPVPVWKRGKEQCTIRSQILGSEELTISALGLSAGTSLSGISARVVEIHDFEELDKKGRELLEGKIVFFNRPADSKIINTFSGYGTAVSQRVQGASEAAKYGAAAVIVRSATQALHDYPHTGVVRYQKGIPEIPAVAVSTSDAEKLSRWLENDQKLIMDLVSASTSHPDAWSYNVVGEIKGASRPGEIITVGGHLDGWDITQGAHDDAGGCVQAIELIRLYRKLNIRPARTVRAVMFMNEEMTGTGGRMYFDEAVRNNEKHYAALESDRGVASPRGFGFDADGQRLKDLQSLSSFLAPYNIRDFDRGGGGSDIAPLKALGTLLVGYIPDTQRYFWYHHSANDTFDKVNYRELQLGSAAIASLIYLIDLMNL